MTRPVAPAHLSLAARRIYLAVVREYQMEPQDEAVLVKACEAFDRAEAARLVIEREGMTYEDRFGAPHARPEVKIEIDNRTAFYRGVRELDLRGGPAVADLPRIASRR
jgi:hypothetical protein